MKWSKLDLVQWIGNGVCEAGADATRFLVEQPACTRVEAWNMGALFLAGVVLVLTIVFIEERRRDRRDYW